ncbi:MAG: zinc ribbon domain-containing protein [Bacillota bacterium]
MREKLTKPGQARNWPGSIPVEYVYTAGVAGEAFLRAIKERGCLLTSGCPGCGASYLPARLYCERCFEKTAYYQDVEARGRVHAFTLA